MRFQRSERLPATRDMPQSCVVVGCTSRSHAGSGIGFFSFTIEHERRRLWIAAVNRKDWQPSTSSRVCGRHFLLGKPYIFSAGHPDYAPCVELSSSAEVNVSVRRNAELALDRFRRTSDRQKKVEQSHTWPVDHSSYTLPPTEQPRKQEPRSKFVGYPPLDRGKLWL